MALANNLNRLLLLIHGLILSYSPVSYSLLLLFPTYTYSLIADWLLPRREGHELKRKTRSKQELQQLECQGQEEAREVSFGKQAPQLIRLSERAGTYYLQAETGQQTYGHLIVSHIYSLLVKSTKRAFTGEIATSSTPLLLPVLNQVVTMRHACRKRALVGEPVGRGDDPPNSHQKSPEHKRNLELRIETKRTTSILGAEVYEEWLFGPFRPVVRTSSFHVEDTGSIPVVRKLSLSQQARRDHHFSQ
ncbi:hypothetical protein VNO77_46944 [Canavalia gladiata]|uniref:Uncharacterized protein n=1 Tax=Canavalia gladiata TaxID=3824 RepID=A0AAN9JIT3_CANGL